MPVLLIRVTIDNKIYDKLSTCTMKNALKNVKSVIQKNLKTE